MAKKTTKVNEEPLEKKLWNAADKLRKNMDAAEYKHVALGLIFLKYISDAFEELYNKLKEGKGDYEGADPEDKNEYVAEKVFFVPASARWTWLQGRAKLPAIGKDIDDAMDAIEKDNPSLKGVLPKVFAQEKLDKGSLGGLVDLVSTATLFSSSGGAVADRGDKFPSSGAYCWTIILLDKSSIVGFRDTHCQRNTNQNISKPSYSPPHYFNTRFSAFALYKSPKHCNSMNCLTQ